MKIYELDGDKDVVVVIPVPNHKHPLAENCANEIFKGQQIVFVESNGPFFNYARSCNFGLKYALKYKPKWIVLSNDDVIKVDPFSKLKDNLSSIDNKSTDFIYITPSSYHTFTTFLARGNLLLKLIRFTRGSRYRSYTHILLKFSIKYDTVSKFRLSRGRIFLYKKFYKFVNFGDFAIFSSDFVSKIGKLFDETFINDYEDLALSLYISTHKDVRIKYVDFTLNELISGTLQRNGLRTFRDIASLCYLQKIIQEYKPDLVSYK